MWPEVFLSTDASFFGFGAILNGKTWLAGTWTYANAPSGFSANFLPPPNVDESLKKNINFLELIAACLPVLVWAPVLVGQKILVLSDNTQTVAFLNRGTTKNLDALKWLKLVFDSCLKYDIRVIAAYSPGVGNVLADALSRLTESENHTVRFFQNSTASFPGPALTLSKYCSYPNGYLGTGT